MSERKVTTYCEAGGDYFDDVVVFCEIEPPERDVNWQGGVTINYVKAPDGRDLMTVMTGYEVSELEERMLEDAYPDPDAYGDYLYQLRKDEGMRA